MEKLLYQYGKLVWVISLIAGIAGCLVFHNAFVIAFCLSVPVMCGYLVIEIALHKEVPHYRIRKLIEKIQKYRNNSMSGIIDEYMHILYSLDTKIYALQDIIGPAGNKTAFVEVCDEYINSAVRVVENCSERLIVICVRENDQDKSDLFKESIEKLNKLLKTMDELALALTDVGSEGYDELISRIRDYANSLNDLQ